MNRTASLRWALLAAIGGVPVACGGSAVSGHDDDGDSGSGAGTGGTATKPGKPTSRAGTTSMPRGGGSSIGGTSATSGGGSAIPVTCTAPKTDPNSGFVTCLEGYAHRPKAATCTAPESFGGASSGEDGVAGAGSGDGCQSDLECAKDPLGFCKVDSLGEETTRQCTHGCRVDDDCGAGHLCQCAAHWPGGECVRSDCRTDADCGGFLCASYNEGCGYGGFACQRAEDQCRSSEDCDGFACSANHNDEPGPGRFCDISECGRPFLVQDDARVAPVAECGDWSGCALPRVDHLTLAERSALAAHWTRMGQLEHASIAAFARFSLQLLSLGAPPELVDACTQALADETAHTKLCFGLASAYAGRAIGPGPLDVSNSLDVTSLADIVDLVIAEGCFGETSAALEALEAAETATDPVIIAAYSQIARDEQRHAELAFRFVRWALERDPEAVTPRVVQALSEQSYSSPAVHDVVEPCLYAVLARRQAA